MVQVARPAIQALREMNTFATAFRWYIALGARPSDFQGAWPDPGEINLRCESAGEPQLTGESTPIAIRGHTIKQQGLHTYSGTLTLTFFETTDNMISLWLKGWRETTWQTGTGISQSRKGSQTDVNLVRLDNLDQPIWIFKMYGFYLETFDPQTLDAATAEYKPSATFSFDYFEDFPV